MTNADLVNEWLSRANDDLTSAEHLFNTMQPIPLDIVAFHCQQSAEKNLKSTFPERTMYSKF
jgi:HEPN domain-containing protein